MLRRVSDAMDVSCQGPRDNADVKNDASDVVSRCGIGGTRCAGCIRCLSNPIVMSADAKVRCFRYCPGVPDVKSRQ